MKPGEAVVLWLAQGLGTGRIRLAPGTWGSLLGVAWTAALLSTGSPWAYGLGAMAGVMVAIPASTTAERLLDAHDPPSVVIDEVVAMPVAFGGHVIHWVVSGAGLPSWATFRAWWPYLAAAFVLFRILDIAKPWPVRTLQGLPGGVGVVVDDIAAALMAAALLHVGTWGWFVVRLAMG